MYTTRILCPVILAGGQGKRMGEGAPKVLRDLGGKPVIQHLIDLFVTKGLKPLVVVPSKDSKVGKYVKRQNLTSVEQKVPLGTGDALKKVVRALDGSQELFLLVVPGDAPLLSASTVDKLCLASKVYKWVVGVAYMENPRSLGRVVLKNGKFLKIVEFRDASSEEQTIKLVNSGFYLIPFPEVIPYLDLLSCDNAQGEFYLTDIFNLVAKSEEVGIVYIDNPMEAQGVNTPEELEMLKQYVRDSRVYR